MKGEEQPKVYRFLRDKLFKKDILKIVFYQKGLSEALEETWKLQPFKYSSSSPNLRGLERVTEAWRGKEVEWSSTHTDTSPNEVKIIQKSKN